MAQAARLTDLHLCHVVAPGPHVGGPVLPAASPTVVTGFLPQARATDACVCSGPPDFIVTGSGSVVIDGLPAARRGDRTMHQPAGTVTMGCETVDIGGETVGVVLGGTSAAGRACAEAAATRHPPPGTVNSHGIPMPSGTTQQSYGNCGLEAARQIINAVTPARLTQEQLLAQAHNTTAVPPGGTIPMPLAVKSRDMEKNGGSWPWSTRALLQHNGVAAGTQSPTVANLTQAVAEGRGVLASVDAAVLWGGSTPPGSWHVVLVTGARYNADGRIVSFVVNDTGCLPPNCGKEYPVFAMEKAMTRNGGDLVVTETRVWGR